METTCHPIADSSRSRRRGVAEWFERVRGEVGRAVELECNAPVRDRKIDAEQPIRRGVLQLVRYAQSAKGLSNLSLTVRHRHLLRSFRMRLHRNPKH